MILYCTHFNFCREHRVLTYHDETYHDEKGFKCKNTFTREIGTTELEWILEELLTFRCFKTSAL